MRLHVMYGRCALPKHYCAYRGQKVAWLLPSVSNIHVKLKYYCYFDSRLLRLLLWLTTTCLDMEGDARFLSEAIVQW